MRRTSTLPLTTIARPPCRPRRVPAASPRLAVLVIERDPQVRHALVRVVERAGHRACSAKRLADAVKVFRRQPQRFDLVIVDEFAAPGGAAAVRRKFSELRPDLAFVLSTPVLPSAITGDALAPGFHATLSKPFGVAEIESAIREAWRAVH